jgi:hypothetical protein
VSDVLAAVRCQAGAFSGSGAAQAAHRLSRYAVALCSESSAIQTGPYIALVVGQFQMIHYPRIAFGALLTSWQWLTKDLLCYPRNKPTMRLMLLFFLLTMPAIPQRFGAGVKAAVPLLEYINTSGLWSSKTNRYTLGPAFEVRLPARFAIETTALYKRLHHTYTLRTFSLSGNSLDVLIKTTAGRIEFPMVLKYRLPARTFVGAGGAVAHVFGTNMREHFCSKPYNRSDWTCFDRKQDFDFTLENATTFGYVAVGGVEIKVSWIRIVPEVRYTRWTRSAFQSDGGLASNRNQAEVFLGFLF